MIAGCADLGGSGRAGKLPQDWLAGSCALRLAPEEEADMDSGVMLGKVLGNLRLLAANLSASGSFTFTAFSFLSRITICNKVYTIRRLQTQSKFSCTAGQMI